MNKSFLCNFVFHEFGDTYSEKDILEKAQN